MARVSSGGGRAYARRRAAEEAEVGIEEARFKTDSLDLGTWAMPDLSRTILASGLVAPGGMALPTTRV